MTTQYIEDLKRRAKKMASNTALTHQQALDAIARELGHAHWGSLQSSINATGAGKLTYKSWDRFILSNGLSVAWRIEALLAEANSIFKTMVAELPNRMFACFVTTSKIDLSFESGLVENEAIPPEVRGLQTKLEEIATHLHAITQETRDLNFQYRLDGRGQEILCFHLRLDGCVTWTSNRFEHGFHHSLEVTGSPLACQLPDMPGSWQAAHNWGQRSIKFDNLRLAKSYRGFDPVDLGFEPCGLFCRAGGAVYGATYKVRDRHPDEHVEELEDAVKRLEAFEGEREARRLQQEFVPQRERSEL